ncbi:MAG: ABC transporter substrate-binding protein, partial [Clostridium sp.]
KKEGITYEIETIPQIPLRLEALRNGLVGGAVLGEPQSSMLTKDGVKIIADAESDYGVEVGAIAFNSEFVKANKSTMKKFYKAYNKAIDYLNSTDVNEYIALVEKYGISSNIAPYLATEEGKFEHAKDFSKEQFENVLAWTKEKGIISNDYKYEDLTNFSYIK